MSFSDLSSGYGSVGFELPKLRPFWPNEEDWEDFEFMLKTTLLANPKFSNVMKFVAIMESIPASDRRLLSKIDRAAPDLNDVMKTLQQLYGKTLENILEAIEQFPDYRSRPEQRSMDGNVITVRGNTMDDWKEIMKLANLCANFFRSRYYQLAIQQEVFNKVVSKLPSWFVVKVFKWQEFSFNTISKLAFEQMVSAREKYSLDRPKAIKRKAFDQPDWNGSSSGSRSNKQMRWEMKPCDSSIRCPVCKGNHYIWQCIRGPGAIRQRAYDHNICYMCLGTTYSRKHKLECSVRCGTCGGAHNTSLHFD